METNKFTQIDEQAVNALRFLSVDAIEKANSGHPGLPLDAAPMTYVLWSQHMKQNPQDSKWINRDRFVLSAGHGSALLYSLLHLSGYKISLEDLQNFRQQGSNTPGHPEYQVVDGADCTTGPLGQGLAMAVGMAMAEQHLAALYNKPNFPVMDHFTFALVGDGCLMEGISHEAASLAGHLKLGKLIVLYDSNDVSLDGPTSQAFTENEQQRFESYGWQYLKVTDGNDLAQIDAALTEAKAATDQPTIIEIKTIIGYGTPKAGTNAVHGAPLGAEALKYARDFFKWDYAPFEVPQAVYDRFHDKIAATGKAAEEQWQKMLADYKQQYPQAYQQWQAGVAGQFSDKLENILPVSDPETSEATRNSSHRMINALAQNNPNFWGGSADLSSSNKTQNEASSAFEPGNYQGENIWYGVREFAEGAAMNGIALHGGTRTYGSTFFVFSDYMRGAIRLAAVQHLPVTYVLTHDSIAVGEDGLTHEPIEQLMSFRAMPGINVIRPADANETAAAWKIAAESQSTPTMLVLSRQNLKVLPGGAKFDQVQHGAYVVSPQQGQQPEGILIATGSEVNLALEAQTALRQKDIDVSVVSMPSFELFDQQSAEYKESVLPAAVVKRMSLEMGSTLGWERYIGTQGYALGIDRFGASGKGEELIKSYGFTVDNVVEKFQKL